MIVRTFTAGEDILPGQVVYHDPLNPGEVKICTDATVVGANLIEGVSKYGADSGEDIDVVIDGEIIECIAGAPISWGTHRKMTVFPASAGRIGPAAAGDQVVGEYVGYGDRNAGEKALMLVRPPYDI